MSNDFKQNRKKKLIVNKIIFKILHPNVNLFIKMIEM